MACKIFKSISPDLVRSSRTCPANLGVRSCTVRKSYAQSGRALGQKATVSLKMQQIYDYGVWRSLKKGLLTNLLMPWVCSCWFCSRFCCCWCWNLLSTYLLSSGIFLFCFSRRNIQFLFAFSMWKSFEVIWRVAMYSQSLPYFSFLLVAEACHN